MGEWVDAEYGLSRPGLEVVVMQLEASPHASISG